MHYIEHIIEPRKLLLAWQSSEEQPSGEQYRKRYIVAELYRADKEIQLMYLSTTSDFLDAKNKGFEGYPAFQVINKMHHNVLDAFMRRLPPKKRGDFSQYLEGLRLSPDVQLSDFGLLGYSGAKLLSDGFSLIHPFDNVDGPCELLLEAAGYRHIQNFDNTKVRIDAPVSFITEAFNQATKEEAIRIEVDGILIGYVNRGLRPTFSDWIKANRIKGSWIEKINGTPGKPAVYLFVKVGSK